MKSLMLIPVLLFTGVCLVRAQQDLPGTKKMYKTWISVKDGGKKIRGVLYEVRDSSVILSNSDKKEDYVNGENYNLSKVDVRNIEVIAMRRKNAIGRGMIIGGLSGAAAGALMGLTTTNTAENPEAKAGITLSSAVFGTIFFGACGAVIGAAFGPIRSKVHIHRNQLQFERKRARLDKRSLTYDPGMSGQKLATFSSLKDTVTDADGNVYHTVALGAMVFMAENLRVTRFRDGRQIPLVTDSSGWRKNDRPGYCNYKNDSVSAMLYGRLYNGFALEDSAGICPAGYHVPTVDEWTSLVLCLGGDENAGGYLKEDGTARWASPNKTLLTGNAFALPSGSRDGKGMFSNSGRFCQWWAAGDNYAALRHGLSLKNESTGIQFIIPGKHAGLSIRCMRDN